jgi:hypothetical protein
VPSGLVATRISYLALVVAISRSEMAVGPDGLISTFCSNF